MFRISLCVLGAALVAGASVRAAETPLYQGQPDWARSIPVPTEVKPSGAAIDVLLWTSQTRLTPGAQETFTEQATRINAPEGLSQVGNIIEVWDPATDTLAIHRARILRGGKVIDLLANGRKFAVIRREINLEAAMIDGALTATLQPEGLQVGDVLDLAVTQTRREPSLGRHSEGGALTAHTGAIGRLQVSTAWPATSAFRTWKTDDLPSLTTTTKDGWTEVGFDQRGAVSPEPPNGAGGYDRLFGLLLASDFRSWTEVSAASYPLYMKAATLEPGSPLLAEIARIRAASSDPKARALAALKLVEQQTRYFYVGLNVGGFTPAAADVTWARRFADCKGKTVLLLALLQGLGIRGEPALVNTLLGEGLDRELPQIAAFNHVIVRTDIDGKVYWLDGTRMGDENLDVLSVPNYHWALPLRAQGAELEPLIPTSPVLPIGDVILKVDARNGLAKPAAVHEEMVFRGDVALFLNQSLKQASQVDADRGMRQALISQRSWIHPDKVAFSYDPQIMEARMTLDGTGTLPFTSAGGSAEGVQDWIVEGASLGYTPDLTRTSDYHRDAPFAVNYPDYTRSLIDVLLPDGGKNFEVFNGETENRTLAGVEYSRSAAIVDGRFTTVATRRAVARSFPAADAASAEAGLRSLADYDVSIRYQPAETAAVSLPPPRTDIGPADVAEAARADVLAKNYEAADAGFTKALAVQPSAKLYYERAVARAALAKDVSAQADLKQALKLDPKYAYANFALGRYALRSSDYPQAASLFSAAEANSAKPVIMSAMISRAYEEAGRYADAYPYSDRLVAAAEKPASRAAALNTSCWLRAEAGQDLKRALDECNAALVIMPGASNILDTRGLVQLRLRAFDKAVEDYTAALTKRPDLATSLFGRSIAEGRLGRSDQAKADADHAQAADPNVKAKFASWGVDH